MLAPGRERRRRLMAMGLAMAAAPFGARATGPDSGDAPSRPAFRPFRSDEDWSALRDPALRTEPLDGLKHLSLDEEDPTRSMTLSGEVRVRYDAFRNPGFGLRGVDHDDFYLQRLLLGADLHWDAQLRFFAQTVSGLQFGSELPASPQQDDALDLQQAFADFRLGDEPGRSLTLRAGRMEMGFGAYRLVSPREPANVRLNFDGVRARLAWDGATVDAFLTRPVEQERGVFDDGENDGQTFWGVYSTVPLSGGGSLNADLYYLGLRRERARFATAAGTEERHSPGVRVWGAGEGFDYDVEGVVQFGDLAGREIRAWTIASNLGYTWRASAWKPRVGLKCDLASGDDPSNSRNGTFFALFPRQGYFSELNLLAPSNFFDVHPSLQVRPAEGLTVAASWNPFWRQSVRDGVYGPGRVAIPAGASSGRYVGSTADLQVEYALTGQLTVTGFCGRFFRGDVVRDAGGSDTDYLGVWCTVRF